MRAEKQEISLSRRDRFAPFFCECVVRRQPWGSQSWRRNGGALRRATFLYGF